MVHTLHDTTTFDIKRTKLTEILFCLSLLSIFLPFKVYPILFLISSVAFFLDTDQKVFPKWTLCLSLFSMYAAGSFLLHYNGQPSSTEGIIKMLINFCFLYAAVTWLAQRDNKQLLQLTDYVFHFIFLLTLLQLIVYHQAFHFHLIYGSDSSNQASMLYNKDLFFWGLADKNMFGARVALLGFVYIMIPVARVNKVSIGRIIFVFAMAYLSLSRTPVVALLIGCGCLLLLVGNKWWRIGLVVLAAAALPFILHEVIRVDMLTASNDGMGVRLVYWKSFFEHFTAIPVWGVGFLGAPAFLSTYADFYHGESHIHNTFMSTYLELGIVGFVSYMLFLIFLFTYYYKKNSSIVFWLVLFLPVLSIMMILYSGYDNDMVVYFTLIGLLGLIRPVNFKTVAIGL